jgi:hypothetical protein
VASGSVEITQATFVPQLAQQPDVYVLKEAAAA